MLFSLQRQFTGLCNRMARAIPHSCALCDARSATRLCPDCKQQFFSARISRCSCCALPLPSAQAETVYCGNCIRQRPAFDATIAVTDYAPPVDQMVLALKFGGKLGIAHLFAELMREAALQKRIDLPTILIAVPLSQQRLAQRGFNQALEIGKPLSRLLSTPLDAKLAQRIRDTSAQALLAPEQRHKNMRQAFAITDRHLKRLRGAHVGIVDDVLTTGATLNELAATLKRSGATRVTNFVFARTLK